MEGKKQVSCTICFPLKEDGKVKKLYKCWDCNYSTKRSNDLTRHENAIHKESVKKMYICQDCSFTTNWSSSLRIHEKRMHKRLFREKIEYHSKIDLKNYILQSDNEYQGKSESKSEIKKMYTCEDCTFSTNWPTSLRRHEKLKHNPCENNQMCKCPSCTFVTYWV